MKALSVLQPWASLLASEAKQWETRSWSMSYRGLVAIHASKAMSAEYRALAGTEPFLSTIRAMEPQLRSLPTGAIVAVASVVGCQPTEMFGLVTGRRLIDVSRNELAFGNFGPGRFAIRIDHVMALPNPIPCRGALGLWEVPESVVEEIYEQLVEAPREVADA